MTYLLLAVLLLVAVPVLAEELLIDSVYLEDVQCAVSKATVNGNTSAYCTPEAVKKKQIWYVININTHPDPCLAKMEEAMKAMSPFLPYVHNGRALDQKELNTVLDKITAAGKLWAGVERECWTKP